MRKRTAKKAISLLLTAAMLLSMVPAVFAVDYTSVSDPFYKGMTFSGSPTSSASNSFRIPALVTLSDGTLVAAADARWNTTYDGGGLDTAVAWSTNNGQSWTTTLANYLGDNGDTYSGSGSTAFIDPALAVTADDTIYMLCDLYPYGVALNGSGHTSPSTEVGFNDSGKLLLSDDNHSSYGYYLDGNTIYESGGTAVEDYTVDAYFNITGTDGKKTNLFFSDSPYKVVRTGYLYLTKSIDKGQTWSAPTLLNLKTTDEMACLVAPGRGFVTSSGAIVFPCYSFHGDNTASSNSQRMSFIYCEDGVNWKRSAEHISGTGSTKNANWASEAAVVELDDGTLRFFVRNGYSQLCYIDYTLNSGSLLNGSWGSIQKTGIATNSNTQLSAITYSKTVGGKQVILVSCPGNESNSSSGDDRKNGKIFAFTVSNGTMTQIGEVSLTSQHSTTNFFMYSCLTELSDGSIGILYEDNESAWGTGDTCYYQMTYATYAPTGLGVTFDSFGVFNDQGVSVTSLNKTITAGNAVNVKYTGLGITEELSLTSSAPSVATAGCCGDTITINTISEGTATITGTVISKSAASTLALNDVLTIGVTVAATDDGGEGEEDIESTITGEDSIEGNTTKVTTNEYKYVLDIDGTISAENPYLIVNTGSNGTGYALTNNTGTAGRTKVTISDSTITVDDDTKIAWEFSGSSSGTVGNVGRYVYPNDGSLSLNTTGTSLTIQSQGNGAYRIYRTDGDYYYYLRYNNSSWTGSGTKKQNSVRSVYLYERTSVSTETTITVYTVDATKQENRIKAYTVSNTGYTADTWNTYYGALTTAKNMLNEVESTSYDTQELANTGLSDLIAAVDALAKAYGELKKAITITIYYRTENYIVVATETANVETTATKYDLAQTITGTDGYSYQVRNWDAGIEVDPNQTVYYVTVEKRQITESLMHGVSAVTYSDISEKIVSAGDASVATAELVDGKLVVTPVALGTTVIETQTAVYTLTVVERGGAQGAVKVEVGKSIVAEVGELLDGETVAWTVSSGADYAGVSALIDPAENASGSVSNAAVIVGKVVTTDTPAVVIATVLNAAGNTVATFTWDVTVTASEKVATGASKIFIQIEELVHTNLYYSINGGSLQKVNGTGIIVDRTRLETELFNIMLFAAPESGYALTYIGAIEDGKPLPDFYSLTPEKLEDEVNADGSDTEAWPFVSAAQTTIPSSSTSSEWASVVDLEGETKLHGLRWPLLEGNFSIQDLRNLFTEAIALGCHGVTSITANGTANKSISFSMIAQEKVAIEKAVSKVYYYYTDPDNGSVSQIERRSHNEVMGIKLDDYIEYTIKVTVPATYKNTEDYGHVVYENVKLQDLMMGLYPLEELGGSVTLTSIEVANGGSATYTLGSGVTIGGTVEPDKIIFVTLNQTTQEITITFTATLKVTYNVVDKLFGATTGSSAMTNVANLSYTYSGNYSGGATAASEPAETMYSYIWYDSYVADFGLPIQVAAGDVTGIISATANHGTVTYSSDSKQMIYTPTGIAPQYDVIRYTGYAEYDMGGVKIGDEVTFGIYITSASNVLYEEYFMAQSGSGAAWDVSGSNDSLSGVKQSSVNTGPYGYDEAYISRTGASGTQYVATVGPKASDGYFTKDMTFSFSGTGFDLIGACGPETGTLMVVIRKNGSYFKGYMIDTSYDVEKIYQAPILHVQGLDQTEYTVTISGAYIDYSRSAQVNMLGYNGQGAIASAYELMYRAGLSDAEMDTVEFISMDRQFGVSTYSDAVTLASTPDTMTLEIDAVRIYHDTKAASYRDASGDTYEYDVKYTNVSDDSINGEGKFYAYVEPHAADGQNYETGYYKVAEYDSLGGPQCEIYLPAGAGIVLKLSTVTVTDPLSKDDPPATMTITTAQISARAVGGETKMVSGTGTSAISTPISTNTEMYYKVAVDGEGCISIVNNGTNMLAIANVKALAPLVEISGEANVAQAVQAVSQMMSAYKAGANDSGSGNDETVQVSQQQWTNGSGQTVTTVPQDSVTAHYTVENPLDTQATVTLMIGAYDVYGKLLDIQTVTFTLAAGESRVLPISMLLPAGTAQVKSFILDGSMNPLFDSPVLYH